MTCPSLKFVIGLPHDIQELYGAAATTGQLIITTDKGVFLLKTDDVNAEWIKLNSRLTFTDEHSKVSTHGENND